MTTSDFIRNIYGLPGGVIFPTRATVETERKAAPRPVESGHETRVESRTKEQGK